MCKFLMLVIRVWVKIQQEAETAWKLQLLRRTWHMNQIFELNLEQFLANYYGDNTIAK